MQEIAVADYPDAEKQRCRPARCRVLFEPGIALSQPLSADFKARKHSKGSLSEGYDADRAGLADVVVKNVPSWHSQSSLQEEMDARGYQGKYDQYSLFEPFTKGPRRGKIAVMRFASFSDALSFRSCYHGSSLPFSRAEDGVLSVSICNVFASETDAPSSSPPGSLEGFDPVVSTAPGSWDSRQCSKPIDSISNCSENGEVRLGAKLAAADGAVTPPSSCGGGACEEESQAAIAEPADGLEAATIADSSSSKDSFSEKEAEEEDSCEAWEDCGHAAAEPSPREE